MFDVEETEKEIAARTLIVIRDIINCTADDLTQYKRVLCRVRDMAGHSMKAIDTIDRAKGKVAELSADPDLSYCYENDESPNGGDTYRDHFKANTPRQ